MKTDQEWEEAKDYLDECREIYTSIGVAGMFALRRIIDPLLIRYERGERTEELYDEIMGVKL